MMDRITDKLKRGYDKFRTWKPNPDGKLLIWIPVGFLALCFIIGAAVYATTGNVDKNMDLRSPQHEAQDSWGSRLYVCARFPDCDSYVGVDERNQSPLGTLANGDLRHKRIEAHKLFDLLWKQGVMTRSNAYRWIGDKFGMSCNQAHIGNFSDYMCDVLIAECRKTLRSNKIAC